MNNFPWDDAAKIGFGLLRLSPTEFWQLTPKELMMIANSFGASHVERLGRARFDEIRAQFPD